MSSVTLAAPSRTSRGESTSCEVAVDRSRDRCWADQVATIVQAVPKNTDVISIDMPWGKNTTARTAIASRSPANISVTAVHDDDVLVQYVDQHAATNALVLLDVPLDGCESLSKSNPRRGVDDRFLRIGIPILPSVKSGIRGPTIAKRLLDARPDLRVREIYPYAVLRVIWALHVQGLSFRFEDDARRVDLSATWGTWPPKYKRAKTRAAKLVAMNEIAAVLSNLPAVGSAIRTPSASATVSDLSSLADAYDALLGLIAGIAAVDRSSWSWISECEQGCGSIVTIADTSLRRRFDSATKTKP